MFGCCRKFRLLSRRFFSLRICQKSFDSTAPWLNPSAWRDKLEWVQRYFGKRKDSIFYKRLIISHHKDLNQGDFLIDDREKNGAKDFNGELIQFGSSRFPDWPAVVKYLLNKIGY